MELLERFSHGEMDAFEALFRRHQGEVYGWIVRIVRDPAAAEDLTIETFWRIWKAHARFDASREFGPWARRIATRLALDHARRAGREEPLECDVAEARAPSDNGLREVIARAFRRLPAKLKPVALAALVEEKPHEEIARALGISAGAVKSRLFRAVRAIRKNLAALGVTR